MAISSWVETGIQQKMEDEITTSAAFRGHFEESFWKNNHAIGNKPLTTRHVLPCFVTLIFGLILSTIIFILEQLLCSNKKKTSVETNESGASATVNDNPMAMSEIQESHSIDE